MTKSAMAYQGSLREILPMSYAAHASYAAELLGMIKTMSADAGTVSIRRLVEHSDKSGTHT